MLFEMVDDWATLWFFIAVVLQERGVREGISNEGDKSVFVDDFSSFLLLYGGGHVC
jgi:hypothetical protein